MKLERHNLKNGNDVLNLMQRQINKLNKAFDKNKGSMIRISKTQMRKLINNEKRVTKAKMEKMLKGKNKALLKYANKKGGNIFSSIIPMATKVLPKIMGNIGWASLMGGVEGLTKKLLSGCNGCESTYIVENNKIPKLIRYDNLLNNTQRKLSIMQCNREKVWL